MSLDCVAHLNKFVSNFPGESTRVFFLVIVDLLFDVWRGYLGLGASDDSRPDGARFLVSVENFGDAAVRHPELTRDDAGADAGSGHLDDLQANVVGERTTVDEDAPELVDATLP